MVKGNAKSSWRLANRVCGALKEAAHSRGSLSPILPTAPGPLRWESQLGQNTVKFDLTCLCANIWLKSVLSDET